MEKEITWFDFYVLPSIRSYWRRDVEDEDDIFVDYIVYDHDDVYEYAVESKLKYMNIKSNYHADCADETKIPGLICYVGDDLVWFDLCFRRHVRQAHWWRWHGLNFLIWQQ